MNAGVSTPAFCIVSIHIGASNSASFDSFLTDLFFSKKQIDRIDMMNPFLLIPESVQRDDITGIHVPKNEAVSLPSSQEQHIVKRRFMELFAGFRECHIKPDWLLIYLIENQVLTLTLVDTGSHSDLFKK